MKKGQFIINGVQSTELKAVIQNRPIISAPRRKGDAFVMPSQSGTVYVDDDTYENTPLDLNIALYGKDFDEADYNRERLVQLFNVSEYVPFRYYVSPNKLHLVRLENVMFESSRGMRYHQVGHAELSVYPFKYTHNGHVEELTVSGTTLRNPNAQPSEPIIKIEGSGDVTLTVNGTNYPIRNINGHIFLHTPVEHAYRESGNVKIDEDHKINTLDYPTFKPGDNVITWTGNVDKIIIEPRWQTLV